MIISELLLKTRSTQKKFNINETYHTQKDFRNLLNKKESLKAIIEDKNNFEFPLRHKFEKIYQK